MKYLSLLVLGLMIAGPAAVFAEDGSATGAPADVPPPPTEKPARPLYDFPKAIHDNNKGLLKAAEDQAKALYKAARPMRDGIEGEGSTTEGFKKDRMASTTAWKGFGGAELRPIVRKAASSTLENVKERATEEIGRREGVLNAFIARLEGAKKLSDGDKSSLTANLEARLAELATLKQNIANGVGTTTLKANLESLGALHKEFRAELPKAALSGAAERILSVVAQMEQFGTKLSTRIDEASAKGTDVTELKSLLSSFNASVASAKTNGQSALDAAKSADTTTAATVKTTIVAAQKNLKDARDTARKIFEGLGGKKEAPAQQPAQ